MGRKQSLNKDRIKIQWILVESWRIFDLLSVRLKAILEWNIPQICGRNAGVRVPYPILSEWVIWKRLRRHGRIVR